MNVVRRACDPANELDDPIRRQLDVETRPGIRVPFCPDAAAVHINELPTQVQAEAEALYQRALTILEKALGTEHPYVAQSLNNLAVLYDTQGKYAEAEPLYKRALAIDQKALGPEHPEVATDLNNLAALYYTLGRYAEAEPLYQRGLAILEKALGAEHPHVAQSLENYAVLVRAIGLNAQAESLEDRAKAIHAKHEQAIRQAGP